MNHSSGFVLALEGVPVSVERVVRVRKTPRQQRSRATVSKILRAAAQVFAEEGYAATTDRVAIRAGVSVGSLYQYFPNKDALLLELAQAHLEESTALLSDALAPGRPSAVWIPAVVDVMAALHADGDLHRVLFAQAPRTSAFVLAFEEADSSAAEAAAALLAAEYPSIDAGVTATVLSGMVESLTHRLVGVLPRERLAEEVTRAALAYLAAVTAAPSARSVG